MKYIVKFSLITVTAAMTGAVIGGIYQTSKNIKNMETLTVDEVSIDMSYKLKDHNGFLAMYRGKSDKPYIVLDYQTSFLNEYDRQLVSEGICVETEKEMRVLLEDFTG
ncbi:MAG: hypothetical protein E7505_10565 [Ruminococcus sp.]|nr:hypothetical protein [Ruminococcus sp.]